MFTVNTLYVYKKLKKNVNRDAWVAQLAKQLPLA